MTSPLPNWIERLLGIETGSGEGTSWRLEHTWGWLPWVTLVAIVLAAGFVIASYVRENPQARPLLRTLLAALRLAALGILLLMLAQFVLSLQRTGLPYVAILVDDTLSMTIVDRYDDATRAAMDARVRQAGFHQLTRWNLARTLLAEHDGALPAKIRENYKLRLYYLSGARPGSGGEVDEILDPLRSMEPAGEQTRLGTAVRAVLDELRGSAPAAVILLSDGINTDGPDLASAAAYARRKGVPLYLVGLGDDKPAKDLKLSDLLVDEVVFVNDVVSFEAKLTATGYAGRKVPVVLREKGKREVLAKAEVTVGPDNQPQQVRIPYRPTREGEFSYVVEAEPQPGELQTDNNRQERTVRVRREKIRVLLVQGEPSFEFRFLRNMLGRESTIELKTVLQGSDPEHAEQDPTALRGVPVRREDLFRYDVIVLGDPDPALLSPSMMQNLVDFVDQPGKGGALISIAGPKYMPLAYRTTPLARLLPVEVGTIQAPAADRPLVQGFTVQPTDLGLASPPLQLGDTPEETAEVWKGFPPLYWMLKVPDRKPGARVLLESHDRDGRTWPIALMQYVGAGKVLFHATDETWRWRYRVGDFYFARYWVQMIRYLTRSKLSEGDQTATLTADRREYRRGDPVRLRVRFADDRQAPNEEDGVTVVVEHQGHPTQRVKLRRGAAGRGVFEAVIDRLPIGSHHAWIAVPTVSGKAPSVDFTVLAPPGEFERVPMDAREMQRAADHTKGRFYTFANADRLVHDLPEGRQVPVESLPPIPLWNTWPLLLAVLTLLIAEWVLRKLGGMV